ncbi:MAG TPA: phage terminase large subunit [Chloroflexota bacterium]|nr:phage terminase large subunit [Chloroflexota bacterium]
MSDGLAYRRRVKLLRVREYQREVCHFPVVDSDVRGGSKEARNDLVTPLAEGGTVWVPSPAKAPWVRGWLQEVIGFPELKHDDRCDAMSMALQRLRGYVAPYCAVIPPVRVDLDRVAF